jgi:hypothetical protein
LPKKPRIIRPEKICQHKRCKHTLALYGLTEEWCLDCGKHIRTFKADNPPRSVTCYGTFGYNRYTMGFTGRQVREERY